MQIEIFFVVGWAAAAGLPLAAIPLLRRARILDTPNHRSLHEVPAVRGIGVVSILGVLSALAAVGAAQFQQTAAVAAALGGCVLAGFLGLSEDLFGLNVKIRLLGQGAVGVGVGLAAHFLGGMNWMWLPAIVVIVVGYINAANFMDGVNGISCLHGLVAGSYFTILGVHLVQPWLTATSAILLAVHLGLLPWNARGHAFLGDVGSYLLGSLVAICGIGVFIAGGSILMATAPALIYLTDTASTMFIRLYRHERITQAHRAHVYQRLVLQGLTHLRSASVVTAASAICSLSAFSLAKNWIPLEIAVVIISMVLVGYLALPRLAGPPTHRGVR